MFKRRYINPQVPLTILLSLLLAGAVTVGGQTPETPNPWIPSIANIAIGGGIAVGNPKKLLSVTADGSKADLYNIDDKSGRQRWVVQRSSDLVSYYIMVGGGTGSDRKYLSASPDGTKVSLAAEDDDSGRQRWILESIQGSLRYRISVKNGVVGGRRFLSTTQDGGTVDLFSSDDNSGRQRWTFNIPDGVKFNIRISGGTPTDKSFLGRTERQDINTLYAADDSSGGQHWTIGRLGTSSSYSIWTPNSGATNRLYLTGNDRPVWATTQKASTDTSTGDQIWLIEDIGKGLVRIKPRYTGTNVRFLSVTADGTKVDLYARDDASGRQRWRISHVR